MHDTLSGSPGDVPKPEQWFRKWTWEVNSEAPVSKVGGGATLTKSAPSAAPRTALGAIANRARQREVLEGVGARRSCPLSTGGGTRRVQLVREGRGGVISLPRAASAETLYFTSILKCALMPRRAPAVRCYGRAARHARPQRRGSLSHLPLIFPLSSPDLPLIFP